MSMSGLVCAYERSYLAPYRSLRSLANGRQPLGAPPASAASGGGTSGGKATFRKVEGEPT